MLVSLACFACNGNLELSVGMWHREKDIAVAEIEVEFLTGTLLWKPNVVATCHRAC